MARTSYYAIVLVVFVGVAVYETFLMNGTQTALEAQKWEWKIQTRQSLP